MRTFILAAFLCGAFCGCGPKTAENEGAKTPVKLEDVPAPALKTAKEKLPGQTYYETLLKKDGTYEVRFKDNTGKIREVEVKADGTFIALE